LDVLGDPDHLVDLRELRELRDERGGVGRVQGILILQLRD
jgi:hypothetical protein